MAADDAKANDLESLELIVASPYVFLHVCLCHKEGVCMGDADCEGSNLLSTFNKAPLEYSRSDPAPYSRPLVV